MSSDDADATSRGADDATGGQSPAATDGPRGNRRLVFAGGFGLIGAVLGYLVVRSLVAVGSLPDQAEVLALPVFGLLGVTGFVLFVASFLLE